MKRSRAALVPITQLGALCVALALLPVAAEAQTWTLKDVRRVEAERVEGRGNDFIRLSYTVIICTGIQFTEKQPHKIEA